MEKVAGQLLMQLDPKTIHEAEVLVSSGLIINVTWAILVVVCPFVFARAVGIAATVPNILTRIWLVCLVLLYVAAFVLGLLDSGTLGRWHGYHYLLMLAAFIWLGGGFVYSMRESLDRISIWAYIALGSFTLALIFRVCDAFWPYEAFFAETPWLVCSYVSYAIAAISFVVWLVRR